MRFRIIAGALAVLGLFTISGIASSGDGVGPSKRWAIVTLTDPVLLGDQFLMGTYLVVHDEEKMARGEPCTSIYRFDRQHGPAEEVIAFHCVPTAREVCAKTTLTVEERGRDIPRLTEYQFAGDSEGHGVPSGR